jgi:hypothetical protein
MASTLAVPTCDPHVTTSPVAWSSNPTGVVSITASGTGNHNATITAIAPGTTTIRACTIGSGTQPCSAWATVTSNGFRAQITSTADGGTTVMDTGSTGNLAFTVTNTGNISGTATISCTALNTIYCSSVNPTSVSLTAGQSVGGTLSYEAGHTVGANHLTLAASTGGTDVLQFSVGQVTQVTNPQIGTTQTIGVNTTGTTTFTVKNVGPVSRALTFTCHDTGSILGCTGLSQGTATLMPAASVDVTATYAAGATAGTGLIRLVVEGNGVNAMGGVNYIVGGGAFTAAIGSGDTFVPKNVECEWTATASGGFPPYTYAWTANGTPIGTGYDLYYTNTGSVFTLGMTATDSHGTVVSDSWSITPKVGVTTCQN